MNPNLIVLCAGLGPLVTFGVTYTISISLGHLTWIDGVTLSQSIAFAPERFVGTFGLAVSCVLVLLSVYIRKCYCDKILGASRGNMLSFFMALCATAGTLGVASVQCGSPEDDPHWKEEVHGQRVVHFICAFLCFIGYSAYICHQTFAIDPKLSAVLPRYTVPIWKKVLTVLPLLCLAGFMFWPSPKDVNDLFEVFMIIFALLWVASLYGTFDGLAIQLTFVDPQHYAVQVQEDGPDVAPPPLNHASSGSDLTTGLVV